MYVVRILLASLVTTARAHMSLWWIREFNFPIGCCNSQGEPTLPSPGDCRGHLALLDTEEGRPQVTWEPGQDAYFKLSDYMYSIGVPGSTHYGGSCQIGFSVDKGQTWKVAASYHGNCPHRDKDMPQVFEFKVPLNIPTGIAVFAWIWLNREHEFFMNCAAVQISSGSSSATTRTYTSFKTVPTKPSTALLDPSNESLRGGEQDKSSGCDEDSIAYSNSYGAKLARSEWRYIKNRHSRKHSRQNYHIHKSNVLASPKKLHRRSENLASDVCDWNTAPRMETSYYSVDAQCAPNAKLNNLKSDDFEIGWGDACGVVEGDKVYTIQNIEC
ncbi:lytic polysaccharide monooxygenase [Bipolaris oryzae ATCC 44560]|uniref:Lytic polysaccharide monooxygenase n=1 Tax=Bipolaris oryzae ATCC 44560 TaxID=930090 RepID=W6YT94_COCMI|nr:lytic polysaccharide monooxygenase [Bipolaris oryzae ATCC 44560]EUC40825.1 lytic polysaccharide monooxygenase [Bipolaris oryzae ATCC 44560]